MVATNGENGLYVSGSLLGEEVEWLIDTGCNVTILSADVFNRIPVHRRPKLHKSEQRLGQADGTPLDVVGEIVVTLMIGPQKYRSRVIVASCLMDGLLGMDLLQLSGACLDLQNGTVRLCGREVPTYRGGENSCCRVTVAETVTIRAGHRVIVETQPLTKVRDGNWLVEPLAKPLSGMLAVAKSVVSGEKGFVPVEVMNPSGEDCVLYKGTHAATLQPVELVDRLQPDLAKAEGNEENFPSTRGVRRVSPVDPDKLEPEIEKLFEDIEHPLTQNEQGTVRAMLARNQGVFKTEGKSLGRTTLVKHDIKTTTEQPIKQRARRIPIHQREVAEQEVEKMLKEDIIEPSHSPWASPIVLVRKKDGSTRFCVDYRKLNAVSIKDAYPLPRIDDTLDSLAGATCFSTLDLASGYWQVGLTEEAQTKSAFVTHSGLYQFKVMPYGLTNAPSTFERLMERVLQGLQWQICLVYIDDVIIYSRTVEEHVSRLELVLQKLAEAGLKLKPKKCHLFRTKVLYLGHIVSADGVSTDPEKVEAVKEWGVPKDLTDVRSFLGLCSYYRRFIPHFSTIAKPLTKLTEKNQEFHWGPEQEEAWAELKRKLLQAPILSYPDPKGEFILDTDASAYGMGAVLSQVQGGQEKVIAYGSKSLTKEERRYCVTRKELLAVVYFVKYYRHYLYGQKFTIRTDHGALRWLINFKDPQGQVARWLEILGTYDFDIQHRPGLKHNNADSMSRGPCRQCGRESTCGAKVVCGVTTRAAAKAKAKEDAPKPVAKPPETPWVGDGPLARDRLKQAQLDDPILSKLIAWKQQDVRPPWGDISAEGASLKTYWAQWETLRLDDGLLVRELHVTGRKKRDQIVVPEKLKDVVLESLHNAVTAGHLGVRRTLAGVRARFFWPQMRQSVERWCEKCDVCAARKFSTKTRKGPMQKYQMGMPMERVSLDLSGPWPVSKNGNRYILVATDHFTKWSEAWAIPDQEAQTVAKTFVTQFVTRFGAPMMIHTDQGRNFESKLFKAMCKLLGVKKTRTTAFNPKSNGQVERLNKTLSTMIGTYIAENQHVWDENLSALMMAYRATPQESTGITPNEMMMGREVYMPIDVQVGSTSADVPQDESSYVEELRIHLENVYNLARESLGASAVKQKRHYDLKAIDEPYRKGDLVWLVNKSRRKGKCPKLQPKWLGPMQVIDKLNDVTYKIKTSLTEVKVVPYEHLKPYLGDKVPNWIVQDD